MSLAEETLRVVEIGYHPSTALCGKLLAALGMTVTRVDPHAPASAHDTPTGIELHRKLYLDAGKDLSTSATGSEAARLAEADVVLTTDPAATIRPGVDVAALRAANPALVVGIATPFGELDPERTPAGGGFQAAALSGMLKIVGDSTREPLALGGVQSEYSSALSLFSGVLFSLYLRSTTGTAAAVSSSVLRSLAYMDWKTQAYHERDGKLLVRGSNTGPVVVPCRDGFLGLYYRPEDWPAVHRVLGLDEADIARFATQAHRDADREGLVAVLTAATAGRSKHELYAQLQAQGVPAGAVLTVPELIDDEQYRSRNYLERHTVPHVGDLVMPAVPWTVDGARRVDAAVPVTREPTTGNGGPLSGIRVLDLSRITAGGRSTQILADFGADVVKLESGASPDPFRHWTMVAGADASAADDLSSTPFRTVGRNKRSLGIDLKSEEAREVIRRLVVSSDVVVENFRRGVMERLGLSFAQLRAWNPRIALLSLSSQGEGGPMADYASYGVTLEALGGLMSVTGYDADSPTWSTSKLNYPDQVVSLVAPGLAVWSVMHSRATGRGMHIDLSQRELVTSLLGEWLADFSVTGEVPGPATDPGDFCVRCRGEDQWLAVSLTTEDDWARLDAAISHTVDLPDTADARGIRNRLESWAIQRDRFDAARELGELGIAAAPVLAGYETESEFPEFFVDVPSVDRVERQFGWPFALEAGGTAAIRSGAPHLGQHSRQILEELDFSAHEVDALVETGVVLDPTRTRARAENA